MHPPVPARGRSLACTAALAGLLLLSAAGCRQNSPAAPEQTTSDSEPTAAPLLRQQIYSETADPAADIQAAIRQATADHKHIILDFGGDWCGDCHVLDLYLHMGPNGALLDKNYVLVHVFIGHMDAHMDIPDKYGVPVRKGVPALAVLDAGGKLLFAQQHKEFEKDLNPADVTAFLEKWKA